jgi:hypothetical protein
MSSEILREIIDKVDLLTPEEQFRLMAALAEKAHVSSGTKDRQHRKWSDLRGMLQYPACGEDAQVYVSRSRREDDNQSMLILTGDVR